MPAESIPSLTSENGYPPGIWRLIDSGHLDGPTNMAVDEAILEGVASGQSRPTLRFYGWEPGCLSLGFRQPWAVVDNSSCLGLGWEVVRRPTGGRAILHIDELTYSVCAPAGEPRVQGGVLESYKRLSQALLSGLRSLGLEPAQAEPGYFDRPNPGPACFDGPSNYEITVSGRKLVGSAQVRKHNVVLQHGTLPLFGDIARIFQGLKEEEPGRTQILSSRLRRQAIALDEAVGRIVSYSEVVNHMSCGFAQALNLSLVVGGLSTTEAARAMVLRTQKYASPSWTGRI